MQPPYIYESDEESYDDENVPKPRVLRAKAIREYLDQGFVLLPGYSADSLAEMNQWVYDLSEIAELDEKDRKGLWDMDFEPVQSSLSLPVISQKHEKRLCRIENFVKFHDGFKSIANGWLKDVVSTLMGEDVVLLKEKLNFKGPHGGAGYAPHCDGPSCMAFSESTRFVTAMIALTSHTIENGCVKVCPGQWDETVSQLKVPEEGGSKKGSGRVGALATNFLQYLEENDAFKPITCHAGSVLLFHGWMPHRSSQNLTEYTRDAAFFIYNAFSEGGDQHDEYYRRFRSAC